MNFLIFRDFPDFSEFIFEFKSFKTIKKRIKRGVIFTQDPRGCNVARKATWQSNADPRKCLRGVEVTRVYIHIYS